MHECSCASLQVPPKNTGRIGKRPAIRFHPFQDCAAIGMVVDVAREVPAEERAAHDKALRWNLDYKQVTHCISQRLQTE